MTTTNNNTARNALVCAHLDMARRVAGKVARRARGLIDANEAESAAMLGLVEAAERYDDGRGIPFIAFAAPRIRGAVLDELRRCDSVPRRKRSMARKIAAAERAVETRTGECDSSEVATALGMSAAELGEARSSVGIMPTMVSFDDCRDLPKASAADHACRLAMMRQALAGLPERDLMALQMSYRDGLKQHEIGKILGVTESRVCQILARSQRALRIALAD